jgi:hypothetical protein
VEAIGTSSLISSSAVEYN